MKTDRKIAIVLYLTYLVYLLYIPNNLAAIIWLMLFLARVDYWQIEKKFNNQTNQNK